MNENSQPGHAEPANSEERIKDKQERSSHNTGSGVAVLVSLAFVHRVDGSQDHHGQRHADSAEKHERTASKLLNDEDGDPGDQEVFGTVAGGQNAGDRGVQTNVVFVNVGGIVRNQIYPTDLLEHLVHVGQRGTVEVAVLVHGEQVGEAALGHLEDGILDGNEFVLDVLVFLVGVVECAENFHGLFFTALENEPAGGLGETKNEDKDNQGEDDLETNREPPADGAWFEVGETEIKPVTDTYTASYQSSFDHDQLAPSMAFRRLRLPRRDGRSVQAVANTGNNTSNDEVGKTESRALESGTDDHDGGADPDGPPSTKHVADPDTGHSAAETA